MTRAPERLELPEAETPSERFARVLAVAIVLATLLVGLVEWLHSVDHTAADAAGGEAQTLSIQRQGELVRAQDQGRLQVDNYALVQGERARVANAVQDVIVATINGDKQRAANAQQQVGVYRSVADLNAGTTSITPDSATSPTRDPRFPHLVQVQQTKESDRLFAEQDANDSRRTDLLGRLTIYEVILTVLAVSIYLLGLSLTLPRGVGRALTGLAMVAVVGSGLTTGVLQLRRPSAPPPQAADEYAEGMQALQGAYVSTGTEMLAQAVDHFSKAIDLRSGFAAAYLQRAKATFLLGSPERNDASLSLSDTHSLGAAIDDLHSAYTLGLRTKELLDALAYDQVLLAIDTNDSHLVDDALATIAESQRLDAGDAAVYLDRAVAELASGDRTAARQSLDQAVSHVVYTDVDAKTERLSSDAEALVAGALTQLDLLGSRRGDLIGTVNDLKTALTIGVASTAGTAGPGSVQQADSLKVDVFPGQLQVTATLSSYDPAKDVVSIQWYRHDAGGLGWTAIPSVSGPVKLVQNTPAGPNSFYSLQNYLQTTNRCLADADYRVEVYLNGKLAGVGEGTAKFGHLVATPMPELQLTMCRPEALTRLQDQYTPGFADAYQSKDKAASVYLFRYQSPPASLTPAGENVARQLRDVTLGYLESSSLITTNRTELQTTSEYFLGLKQTVVTQYDVGGGNTALMGSGVAPDGSVVVVVVMGAGDSVAVGGSLNTTYNSIIRLGEGSGG